MTCEDCTAAAAGVWPGFTYPCRTCCARALARGQHFRRVRDSGLQDRAYRAALTQFGLSHEEVREAANNDFESKGTACPSSS